MNTNTATENQAEPLPDYSGKLPGDNGYNLIGAKVKAQEEIYGISFQYHTKRGIEPVFDDNGETTQPFIGPLTLSQVTARDKFVADLQRAARRQP